MLWACKHWFENQSFLGPNWEGGLVCLLIIRIGQLVTTLYNLVPRNISISISVCLNIASTPFSVNRAMIFSLDVIKTHSVLLTFACLGSMACILTVGPQPAADQEVGTPGLGPL